MTACSNDDSFAIDSDINSEFVNPMAYIGDIHNQGLESISVNDISVDSVCSYSFTFVEDRFPEIAAPNPRMSQLKVW